MWTQKAWKELVLFQRQSSSINLENMVLQYIKKRETHVSFMRGALLVPN